MPPLYFRLCILHSEDYILRGIGIIFWARNVQIPNLFNWFTNELQDILHYICMYSQNLPEYSERITLDYSKWSEKGCILIRKIVASQLRWLAMATTGNQFTSESHASNKALQCWVLAGRWTSWCRGSCGVDCGAQNSCRNLGIVFYKYERSSYRLPILQSDPHCQPVDLGSEWLIWCSQTHERPLNQTIPKLSYSSSSSPQLRGWCESLETRRKKYDVRVWRLVGNNMMWESGDSLGIIVWESGDS